MSRRNLHPNFHSPDHGLKLLPGWLTMPAHTVLPFIRSPLGAGTVHPFHVARRTAILVAAAWVASAIFARVPVLRPDLLVYFALVYLALCIIISILRLVGRHRGEELHSREAGHSWLAHNTNLPLALSELIIMPLAVAALGYAIDRTLSVLLGWWVITAAASLFLMTLQERRAQWSAHQSNVDDVVRAQAHERRMSDHDMRRYQGSPPDGEPRVFADLAGRRDYRGGR